MFTSGLLVYTSLVGTTMTLTCLGRGLFAAGTRLLKGEPKEAAAELAQGIVDPAVAVGEALNYAVRDAKTFGAEVTARSRQTWSRVWAQARAAISPAQPMLVDVPFAAHAVTEEDHDDSTVSLTMPAVVAEKAATGTEPAPGVVTS